MINLKSIYRKEFFTTEIGLVILDDFLQFTLKELLHLKFLLNLLRTLNKDRLRFILNGWNIGNLKNILVSLIGRAPENLEIIPFETSPKNPFELIFWMPKIELEEKGNQIIARRTEYIDEVSLLVAGLIGKMKERNVLIWHAFAPLSEQEIENMKEKIITNIQEKQASFKIFTITDPKDIPILPDKFDCIILLGLPRDFKRIKNIVGGHIKENGKCIIVIPEDGFSYYISRRSKLDFCEEFGTFYTDLSVFEKSIIKQIERNYLLLLLHHIPYFFYELKIFENIWGEIKNFQEFSEFWEIQKNEIKFKKKEGLPVHFLKWGTISEEVITFYLDNKPFFNEEIETYPFLYFPDKIFYIRGEKYILTNIDIENKTAEIKLATPKDPVKRIPEFVFENISFTSDKIKKLKLENLLLSFSTGNINLSATFKGYRECIDYNISGRDFPLFEISPSIRKDIKTIGIKISIESSSSQKKDFSHEIAHILKIFMPVFFPQIYQYIFIFIHSSNVYIIPLNKNITSIIKIIYDKLEQIFKYDFLVEYLISCPCEEGCPLCLKILECSNENLVKKDFLNSFAQTDINFKFLVEGLKYEDAKKEYEKIRSEILTLFKNHLEIEIENPVPLICVPSLKEGIMGVFDPKEKVVKVIDGLKKRDAIQIIAHEYTHNYEYEKNLLKKDDQLNELLMEGFAQWISFKIMFFYGLVENMREIKLREFDKYGLGFNLLYWLEKKVGFYGVIDFIKEGKVKDPESEELYDLPKIIKEFGRY